MRPQYLTLALALAPALALPLPLPLMRAFIHVRTRATHTGPHNWNYGDFLMTGGAGCGRFQAGDHCPGQNDAVCGCMGVWVCRCVWVGTHIHTYI